ncbi:MAG: alpha/beta fold hydrolase [Ardenticatenaceae bacterium]|nr:alpha/beta fold hydrolase [Ardenticatenaceae bacterium]
MPLTFDLPYEELMHYTGRNPRPGNFDEYWETALQEVRATSPDVQLVRSDFQTPFANCYHMYFTGTNGARIHAKLLKPVGQSEPGPAVLLFHGYSGSSGDWVDKLGYVAAGYTVAALDCRGQGGLSEDISSVKGWTLRGHIVRGLGDDPSKMLYRHIFLDTVKVANLVMAMPEVDETQVSAAGYSQGGALTLVCAALEPKIKKAAAVYPFLCDYQRVWELDLAKDAYAELHDWFRRFDPQHRQEEAVFTQLGYIDVQHLASRIQANVRLYLGLMDEICPPSTQFAAYNKIKSEKSLRVYPDFGHEALPGLSDDMYNFLTAD